VTITAQRQHKEALIKITDQGPGIAASELSKIFERFYRSDSSRAKPDGGGYGLGLAIAKKIADAHGGHIEVRSAASKGSTFILHLSAA
jgi:signal transduction histidine kinase